MGKLLWSYVLMALIAVCMVGLLAKALDPIANTFTLLGSTISTALAGSK